MNTRTLGLVLLAAGVVSTQMGGCGSSGGSSVSDTESHVWKSPSPHVGVFYYPWYGNPTVDGTWVHWDQAQTATSKIDIGSDFYPTLGAYSCNDAKVIAQQFEWLRESRVGFIAASWWGKGSYEDKAIPVLLQEGKKYGIKVAFHIEPYGGRTPASIESDIKYLYQKYGAHPAFYRIKDDTLWDTTGKSKGLFFVWAVNLPGDSVSGWQKAMDNVHALSDGAVIIADTNGTAWHNDWHFDGVYNYASLNADAKGVFDYAKNLPAKAWYCPSVIPGFTAVRSSPAGDPGPYVPRNGGQTYDNQWKEALNVGVTPKLVTITSFNEWHEGTNIEPAKKDVVDSNGMSYLDYGSLGSKGYLEKTRKWVETFLAMPTP